MAEEPAICPHCQQAMRRFQIPDEIPFDEDWHWLCFNNDCPYFVKGWKWMEEKYGKKASYRHRMNPEAGESGPMAVWSYEALGPLLYPED